MPLFILLISYIVGSFPTAYLIGRRLKGEDIRQLGDGNMGAGNTFRELGPWVGIGVFFIDVLKGFALVVLAHVAQANQGVVLWCGILAVIGHNWPIFLHFRGGRGVSTTIGVLVAVLSWPAIICLAIGSLALVISKRVTPAAAIGFILLPITCWAYGYSGQLIIYSICLPVLAGFTHYLRVHAARVLYQA